LAIVASVSSTDPVTLTGGSGADSITGSGGADTITGGAGPDTVMGGGGNDTFVYTSGADVVYGGAWDGTTATDSGALDIVDLSVAAAALTVSNSFGVTAGSSGVNVTLSGIEGVISGAYDDTLAALSSTASYVDGGGGNDGITGGSGNDTLIGNSGNDTITGGAGADSINGGTGNDSITGGDGADTIDFSTGTDTYVHDAVDDSYATGTVTSGTTVLSGSIDVVTGAGNGDIFSFALTTAFAAAISSQAPGSLITLADGTASGLAIVRGTYSTSTGKFTVGTAATDDDYLLQVQDAEGDSTDTLHSVVLLDIVGTVSVSATTAGVITLGVGG